MMVLVYNSTLEQSKSLYHRGVRKLRRELGLNPKVVSEMSLEQAQKSLSQREFPLSVNIIVGNSCFLSCKMCPYHNIYRSSYFNTADSMRPDVVEKLIDEIPKFKNIGVKFGGYEEPTMYPAWHKMAEVFTEKGIRTHTTTNGLLIRRNLDVLSKFTTIYVSMDAHSPDTYREIRGAPSRVGGKYNKVADYRLLKENVHALAEAFKGYKLGVSFTVQDENRHEKDAFVDYWLNHVDMVILYAELYFKEELRNKTQYRMMDRFTYPKLGGRIVCSSPFLETYVMPNGDVTLCCQTLLLTDRTHVPVMGNILKSTLKEIWDGESYTKLRSDLIKENWSGQAEICKSCPLWASSYYEQDMKQYQEGDRLITINPTTMVIEKVEK